MSQHTPPPRQTNLQRPRLPKGCTRLHALDVAVELVAAINTMPPHRGLAHLRDHLVRAADNTALRLAEASGRTMGNRYQHLEAAYAENQEVQSDLDLIRARGLDVPPAVVRRADRLGGMIYGLVRAEARGRGR